MSSPSPLPILPFPIDSFHFPPCTSSTLKPHSPLMLPSSLSGNEISSLFSLPPPIPIHSQPPPASSSSLLPLNPSSSLNPPSSILGPPPSDAFPQSALPTSSPGSSLQPPPLSPEAETWSSRVKASLRTLTKILPNASVRTTFRTHVPNPVLEEAIPRFDSCLLGQFYGKSPNINKISQLASALWGKISEVRSFSLENGDIVFRFKSKEARDLVLAKPLWYLGNLPMVVSEWHPGYTPDKPSLSHVPMWVVFKGVPLELFSRSGMSYVASVVGDPLYLDKATDNLYRLDQARAFVIVNLLDPLPDVVTVSFDNGKETHIRVEYPW